MEKIDIAILTQQLNEASDAYYNTGRPIMDDAQFDYLMDQLKKVEKETGIILSNSPTQNVGAKVVDSLQKITHDVPMLSLDKCHTEQELIDFAENDDCYLSVKCDGISTRLVYKSIDGKTAKLVEASTRGDGKIGNDILFHVTQYLNVPLEIPYGGEFIIDGESVIFQRDFEKICEELPEDERFKNPRNLVAGTLGSLDSNLTKQRYVRFIAWRVIKGGNNDSSFRNLKHAEDLGFTIVPMWSYNNNSIDKKLLPDMLTSLKQMAKALGLPMDGVVMSKDSLALSKLMGRTEKFFRHSIAFKFEDEIYPTKLDYIDWTIGKTGVLTPTAVFLPVEIDGTEVSRASLHNISIMKYLGLTSHCTAYVFKANMIIPQIKSCEDDGDGEIEIPEICPICGGKTEIVCENTSEVLMCTNPDCAGKKIGQFTHFCSRKAMDINGLSESTLELLISNGYIKDFQDIFTLFNHRNELIHLPRMGEKSVENLLKSIEKARETTMVRFIAALGIPQIGTSAAKTIAEYCDYRFDNLLDLWSKNFDWTQLEDFGEVMANNLNQFIAKNYYDMISLYEELDFIVPIAKVLISHPLAGKNICITGKLKNYTRDEINSKIFYVGAKAVSSVSKTTDFLVTNETSGSSKYKKAVELGIKIITENELINMIGE